MDYSSLFNYNAPAPAPLQARTPVANSVPTNSTFTNRPTAAPVSSVAPQTGWQRTNSFLGSNTGQLVAGGVATGLAAYANSRARNADREAAAEENELNRAQRAEESRQNALARAAESIIANQRSRATEAVRPLGEGAAFAQRQARGSAIADLLGQRQMSSNPRIASAQGSGLRISPDVIARIRQASGADATASALAQRDMDIANVNPASQGTDLATMTGLRPESPFLSGLIDQRTRSQQNSQDTVDESESYARQLLSQAIDMPSLSQPGGAAGPAAPFRTAQRRPAAYA